MSKVWKNPIILPQWVTVSINGDVVAVQGPKGILSQKLFQGITAKLEENVLTVLCDNVELWKYRGTMRALLAHMVKGVSEGYTKSLQVIGVWFDAALQGNSINFKLWFSHPVVFAIPGGIEVKIEKDPKWNALIHLASHDKQLIGEVAAKIRKLKKPEPYKGKGIRSLGEVIKLKAGKAAKK
jgi:large subunit ribosomal protein L6